VVRIPNHVTLNHISKRQGNKTNNPKEGRGHSKLPIQPSLAHHLPPVRRLRIEGIMIFAALAPQIHSQNGKKTIALQFSDIRK
jgi:hypothetical protein